MNKRSDALKQAQKRYAEKHKEKRKQWLKKANDKYKNKDIETFKAKRRVNAKRHRVNNPKTPEQLETISEYNKEYYQRNKEKLNAYWRGHQLPSQTWRYTHRYRIWRESIYKRDEYTCQHCNKTNCEVHAHHIKDAANHPELRLEVTNGITLCKECHQQLHS